MIFIFCASRTLLSERSWRGRVLSSGWLRRCDRGAQLCGGGLRWRGFEICLMPCQSPTLRGGTGVLRVAAPKIQLPRLASRV